MSNRAAKVLANWDAEGSVWMATSYDIPGLVLWGNDEKELLEKIQVAAWPLDQASLGEVPFESIDVEFIKKETISPVLAA